MLIVQFRTTRFEENETCRLTSINTGKICNASETAEAKMRRDILADLFMSISGAVDFQWRMYVKYDNP